MCPLWSEPDVNPAEPQQQLHLAPVHREGEDKLKSPVKIWIHRAAVFCCFFVQGVNRQENFRIQLISISHWSLQES